MANLSIEPGDLNVTAQRGKTWSMVQTVRDTTGQIVNLTGYTCTWALAETYGGSAVITRTVGTGITMGGTAGTIAWTVPPAITSGVAVGQYVHEFELVAPDQSTPPYITGTFVVTGEAVR